LSPSGVVAAMIIADSIKRCMRATQKRTIEDTWRHIGVLVSTIRPSKRDDSYIRRLLVIGTTAVIRRARQNNAAKNWTAKPLTRKPQRMVSLGPIDIQDSVFQ